MSLLSESMTSCVFLNKNKVSDGEGGYVISWTEGAQFEAAIVFDSSMEARAAEKAGVTSLYTVSVPKGLSVEYHDVFKRLSDGKVFRATSDGDDKKTPQSASFQISQFTAEEFEPSTQTWGDTI